MRSKTRFSLETSSARTRMSTSSPSPFFSLIAVKRIPYCFACWLNSRRSDIFRGKTCNSFPSFKSRSRLVFPRSLGLSLASAMAIAARFLAPSALSLTELSTISMPSRTIWSAASPPVLMVISLPSVLVLCLLLFVLQFRQTDSLDLLAQVFRILLDGITVTQYFSQPSQLFRQGLDLLTEI